VNKPRDMLEFFRRTAPEQGDAPPPQEPPALEPTTRMLVLRRSQAVVAGAAAVAAVVLAFVLGYAAGSPGDAAALPGVWAIRAKVFGSDGAGPGNARLVKEQLEKMDLGDEVTLLDVPSQGQVVVAVGSWLSNPAGRKDAVALRDRVRAIKNQSQAAPFADADFWPVKR
jgi:hypothetical protein